MRRRDRKPPRSREEGTGFALGVVEDDLELLGTRVELTGADGRMRLVGVGFDKLSASLSRFGEICTIVWPVGRDAESLEFERGPDEVDAIWERWLRSGTCTA